MARRIAREGMTWTAPLARIVLAAAANVEGDRVTAIATLRAAVERAEAADMRLYASAAQYQLGCLVGGDEGDALRSEAERAMTAEGVRAPGRAARWMVPGRWGSQRPE